MIYSGTRTCIIASLAVLFLGTAAVQAQDIQENLFNGTWNRVEGRGGKDLRMYNLKGAISHVDLAFYTDRKSCSLSYTFGCEEVHEHTLSITVFDDSSVVILESAVELLTRRKLPKFVAKEGVIPPDLLKAVKEFSAKEENLDLLKFFKPIMKTWINPEPPVRIQKL